MKLGFKRIIAFIIDCTIIYLILMLLGLFIPVYGDVDSISERTLKIQEELFTGEISEEVYLNESKDLSYDLAKATFLQTIAGIVIYILYFVVYQAYNNGQTLGKKILSLQVLKKDDELPDINCLIKRCLIPYGVLVNFILVVLILFVSKSIYLNINDVLSRIHLIVIFVSTIMLFSKGGSLHDYLAKTKVIEL